MSNAHLFIYYVLKNLKINFLNEASDSILRNPETGRNLFLDFLIWPKDKYSEDMKGNICIEVCWDHHCRSFMNKNQNFKDSKQADRDLFKHHWCLEKGIHPIWIYSGEFKRLELRYYLSEVLTWLGYEEEASKVSNLKVPADLKALYAVWSAANHLTFDKAQHRIDEATDGRFVLDEESYSGFDLKCQTLCLDCGHEWEVVPRSLFYSAHEERGTGCPQCARKQSPISRFFNRFDSYCRKLERFHAKYGHSLPGKESHASLWKFNNTVRKYQQFLCEKDISRLEAIDFVFETPLQRDRDWVQTYSELVLTLRKIGLERLPRALYRRLYPELYVYREWINHQKHFFKLAMEGRHRSDGSRAFSDWKVKKLEEIGISWSTKEDSWWSQAEALFDWHEKYGNLEISSAEKPRLYEWLRNQKRFPERLSSDQREFLEELGVDLSTPDSNRYKLENKSLIKNQTWKPIPGYEDNRICPLGFVVNFSDYPDPLKAKKIKRPYLKRRTAVLNLTDEGGKHQKVRLHPVMKELFPELFSNDQVLVYLRGKIWDLKQEAA